MLHPFKTKIKEIFTSIQGEGLYVGENQIFIRFSKCNLNCDFCDTDFNSKIEYTTDKLYNEIKNNPANTISFTGGEPLADYEFLKTFLKEYKNKLNKKIYLETNGTLYNELNEIIDYVDVVAMDIKLKSATKEENRFFDNEKFLKIANKKETFIKIVYDKNILDDEINKTIELAKKENNIIILQPKMPIEKGFNVQTIFDKYYEQYKNIRLIPQVHKFLNIL